MIILDTNVLSALMRAEPERAICNWLDHQPAESIWISSITFFEARFGMLLLAKGRRRTALEAAFRQLVEIDLNGRILDFDKSAADEAARVAAERQMAGRTIDIRDTQIAGIALARRASLATRNIKHFQDLNLAVVNPWGAELG